MITPEYCQVMARYNAWQNDGLRKLLPQMDVADLTQERGAFFGSIMKTVNHLLWGDQVWLSRFGYPISVLKTADRGVDVTKTASEWAAERFRTDAAIKLWSLGLKAVDLTGDLVWTNTLGVRNSEKTWVCATHFFNHQTHHRGQVHAMLTAAGQTLPDTDLTYLPQEQ